MLSATLAMDVLYIRRATQIEYLRSKHSYKKFASYALTVNTTLYINYGNRTYNIQERQWLH